jgi:hypothetical protein
MCYQAPNAWLMLLRYSPQEHAKSTNRYQRSKVIATCSQDMLTSPHNMSNAHWGKCPQDHANSYPGHTKKLNIVWNSQDMVTGSQDIITALWTCKSVSGHNKYIYIYIRGSVDMVGDPQDMTVRHVLCPERHLADTWRQLPCQGRSNTVLGAY